MKKISLLAAVVGVSGILSGFGSTIAAIAAPSLCDSISGNIVTNCGFEGTPNFVGWALSGNLDGNTFVATANGIYVPNSGNNFAQLGAVGSLNLLYQDLNTTPSLNYTISLWMASDGATPNEFDVEWNGVSLFDQTNIPAMAYQDLTFNVVGTGLDRLTISSRNDPAYLTLDDVSVVAAVPEPSTLGLIGLGLLGLGAMRRRRAA